MMKKLIIGALALVLVSAVAVGAYDAFKAQPAEAQAVAGRGTGGNGQGQGQGYGGGQANATAQPLSATAQAQSPTATPAQAGPGASTNLNPGTPQAIPNTQWTPLGATVQAVELTGLSVLTDDGQPLWVQLGPNRFWTAGIGFTVGDHVTVTGFTENGQWMAAVIVNDATGQSLTLRSDTGQPLWTGGNGGNH
jgi:hypothetical protein